MTKYNIKTHLISNINLFPVFSISDSQYSFRSMNKLTSGQLSLRKKSLEKVYKLDDRASWSYTTF